MCMHRRFHEANIVVVPCKRAQHCCTTLRRSQNNRNVGDLLRQKFDRFQTIRNKCQQVPTSANIVVVPCKRTQHVRTNNVACRWVASVCMGLKKPNRLVTPGFSFYPLWAIFLTTFSNFQKYCYRVGIPVDHFHCEWTK